MGRVEIVTYKFHIPCERRQSPNQQADQGLPRPWGLLGIRILWKIAVFARQSKVSVVFANAPFQLTTMTTIFHNPRCSKSRQAVQLLEDRAIEFDVVKYLDDPPSERELSKIVKMLGIRPSQLVRKGEQSYKDLGLSDKELTDKQWIEILVANPKLIERPIVVHDGKAAIGRPIENIEEILKD
ncbi:Arsenate reductase [Roseimaritima multifibrata]|uniref:Arsenate reductase n=2 Tax=Roseimaritima multifibrata TaxID=1930274 RepID=A0A517MHT7_9BACT|nr:Arsenate reductase [Roseimaritima multifibrata]